MCRRAPASARDEAWETDFGRPGWCSDTGVASRANALLPKSKRSYFDSLPAKVVQKFGELSDVLVLQPNEVQELVSAPPPRARSLGRGPRGLLPGAPSRVPGGGEGGRVLPLEAWPRAEQAAPWASEATPSFPSGGGRPVPVRPQSAGAVGSRGATASGGGSGWRRQPFRGLSPEALTSPEEPSAAATAPVFVGGRLLPSCWRVAEGAPGAPGAPGGGSSEGEANGSAADPDAAASAASGGHRGPPRRQTSQRRQYRPSVLAEMHPELRDFFEWTEAKHGHLVTLWHKLDQDGSMTLRKAEFFSGLKALRYEGDLDLLWTALDSDRTGILTFTEFVPENALELARFKHWCIRKFGSLQLAFRAIDADRSGRITMKEFSAALDQMSFESESATTLFLLLDSGSHTQGTITESELLFLDRWQCPGYLYLEPDVPAQERFKIELVKKFKANPLRAWTRLLDKDKSMRIAYDEFGITCKELRRRGFREAAPKSGVASLFAAFDPGRSGWFSLQDWDAEAYEALYAFVHWARGKSGKGKVTDLIRKMAGGGKAIVDWTAFKEGLKGSGLSNTQIPLLFDGLCPSRGALTAADVGFLDRWDPAAESQEKAVWKKLSQRRARGAEAFKRRASQT